jgi:hypothetical protein
LLGDMKRALIPGRIMCVIGDLKIYAGTIVVPHVGLPAKTIRLPVTPSSAEESHVLFPFFQAGKVLTPFFGGSRLSSDEQKRGREKEKPTSHHLNDR